MAVEGALLAVVSEDDRTFWWIALGSGVAVIAVVVALFVLLLRLLADVDEQVAALAPTEEVHADTATARRLSQAAATVEELRRELLSQRELMEER